MKGLAQLELLFTKTFKWNLEILSKSKKLLFFFRQETLPGSRLDRAYLIKELDGTCVLAHQREAPKDTTKILTRLSWFTLPGFEPATLNLSIATFYITTS